jgi:SAM-dependent methyltransferase
MSEEILSLFDSNKKIKICEVGYGRGLLADLIRINPKCKGRVSYYAIEPNHFLAEQGRKKGDHIVEKMIPPFPDGKDWNDFDIVIFSHVIEHFHHYDTILTVLEESYNKLVCEGYVIALFPDYLDYKEDFFSVDHSHEYILTLRRMTKLFIDSHFKVVKKRTYRSCFRYPLAMFIYPFHVLVKFFANILWNITGNDLFFKMKITFAKNICLIAKKEVSKDT